MKQKDLSLLSILKLTIPVFMGYISAGIAFGILSVKLGLSIYQTILMSLIVYAGAAQFLAVGLFASGTGFIEIFIAIILLNLRHSFYGLSLLRAFRKLGLAKIYLIFGLTDETFAILQTMPKISDTKKRKKAYLLITVLNHIYWIIGGFLGALLGESLKINHEGIGFALTALFVVLAIELYKKSPNKKILILSLMIALFGFLFVPKSYMLVVCIGLALVLLLGLKRWING